MGLFQGETIYNANIFLKSNCLSNEGQQLIVDYKHVAQI
jgi:hypothetical protein